MKKYEYENATVYITIPNEKQIENIRNATEKFIRRLMKEKDFYDYFNSSGNFRKE